MRACSLCPKADQAGYEIRFAARGVDRKRKVANNEDRTWRFSTACGEKIRSSAESDENCWPAAS